MIGMERTIGSIIEVNSACYSLNHVNFAEMHCIKSTIGGNEIFNEIFLRIILSVIFFYLFYKLYRHGIDIDYILLYIYIRKCWKLLFLYSNRHDKCRLSLQVLDFVWAVFKE